MTKVIFMEPVNFIGNEPGYGQFFRRSIPSRYSFMITRPNKISKNLTRIVFVIRLSIYFID